MADVLENAEEYFARVAGRSCPRTEEGRRLSPGIFVARGVKPR